MHKIKKKMNYKFDGSKVFFTSDTHFHCCPVKVPDDYYKV